MDENGHGGFFITVPVQERAQNGLAGGILGNGKVFGRLVIGEEGPIVIGPDSIDDRHAPQFAGKDLELAGIDNGRVGLSGKPVGVIAEHIGTVHIVVPQEFLGESQGIQIGLFTLPEPLEDPD